MMDQTTTFQESCFKELSQRLWHSVRQAWKSSIGSEGHKPMHAANEPPGQSCGPGVGEGVGDGDGVGDGVGTGPGFQHISQERPSSARHCVPRKLHIGAPSDPDQQWMQSPSLVPSQYPRQPVQLPVQHDSHAGISVLQKSSTSVAGTSNSGINCCGGIQGSIGAAGGAAGIADGGIQSAGSGSGLQHA